MLSVTMMKTNKWNVQTERKFILTKSQIIIVNENTITRKMDYDELRGLTVLLDGGAKWPPKENIETYDSEFLIHVNKRYD